MAATHRAVPLFVTGTKSSSGDNTLITAIAATRIVITGIVIQNESTTGTTMILKSGSTAFWRVLAQNQGDGLAQQFESGLEWVLGTNEALVLNLSGANSCGYSVSYFTEAA